MSHRRRPEEAPPPDYGRGSQYFSVEINHGGYFLGTGRNRSYVNGAVIWYDHVDAATWSPGMLENIIEEIGYEMSGRIKVHYCIPILSLSNNGLRQIRDAHDTEQMLTFVSIGKFFISLYLDHGESLRARDWDDVVQFPVSELPAVISPTKARTSCEIQKPAMEVVQNPAMDVADEAPVPMQVVLPVADDSCIGARTRRRKRIASVLELDDSCSEKDEAEEAEDEDSDFDPEDIVDSECEISEDDDDLYDQNVDEDDSNKSRTSANKGKEKVCADNDCKEKDCRTSVCKEEYVEDEDMWAPESDAEMGPSRVRTFREGDLIDPKFHSGLLFDSVELLRRAIQAYSCKNRKNIKMPTNDRQRVKAVCTPQCSWYMWASGDSRTKSFRIKKFNGEHTCSGTFKVQKFTSNFLADKYVEMFRADPNVNMKNFVRIISKEWCMTPSRPKLQRARRLALKVIYGDEEAQYDQLWDFGNELRKSNPGSTFYLSTEQGRFKRCYMSLQASKLGFLEGCRPVIFVDGCFIKTRFRGQLLTAVGMDPNNCIFPIAIASVEVEDTSNWTWFLDTVKNDLGILNTTPWTIMSDKQKGLINAVKHVFPDAEHRFCVRHLWQNFSQKFRGEVLKNQLWKIARSSTVIRFEANMEAMKVLNPEAHAWLDELDPKTWVRAFQSELPKCDILLNNNCEVFNKYILEARELPVLAMFTKVKSQVMVRHYNKQKEQAKWKGAICPKIKKMVDRNSELSKDCFPEGAGDGLFAVGDRFSSTASDYVVDLKTKTCTCRRWQQSGIPCPHVIACRRQEESDPMALVDKAYSIQMHQKAYGHIVTPCKDLTEWEKTNGPKILPPVFHKHVGRPTKKRRKAPGEIDCRGGGKKMSRHGVIMHCSYCGEPGHNRNGCYWFKNGLPVPNANVPPQPPADNPEPEPNVTQGMQQQDNMQQQTPLTQETLVESMVQDRPPARNMAPQPIPESSFITAAQSLIIQDQPTSSTVRQGDLAQKLLALQREKNKAAQDRRDAILEAKLVADLKKAQDAATRRVAREQKKLEEAQARAAELALKREKKKEEAELNKKARAETRRIIAEVNKEVALKKKQDALEKKEAEKKLTAEKKRNEVLEQRIAQRVALQQAAAERAHLRAQEMAALHREAAQRGWNANAPRNAARTIVASVQQQVGDKVNMFDEFRAPRSKE